jgi:outer membrane protein OmpA-like peptidoglycan-associated protein
MTKATSFRDPFVRPTPPQSGGGTAASFGMASDHFRDQAALKAAKTISMKPDAFAAKRAGAIPNPFDPKPREVAMRPEKVTQADDDFRHAVTGAPPKPVRVLRNGAALKVVQPRSESLDDIRLEFQEKVRASKPARSVAPLSVAGMMAAASAAVESFGGRGEASGAEASGARGRAGSGGGGGRKPPNIDRAFNQDDLVAILIVLALLLMLGLYFIRGDGGGQPQQLASTVAADPVAQPQAAPAPPAPLKDPFGDQPLDLTPKAAPPAEVAVAPTPAPAPTPACAAGHTMRAFFCTDRADLTDNSKLALEKELADWNACFKDRELVVTGYADTRGPNAYNTYLGGERAKVVADFLKSRGIKVAQLTGVGELEGLTDNENCANQRRVDISFAGEDGAPSRSCAPPQDLAALVCG